MIGEVGLQATQLVLTKYLGEANEKAKEDPKYAQSKEYKELQAKWGVGSDFQRACRRRQPPCKDWPAGISLRPLPAQQPLIWLS